MDRRSWLWRRRSSEKSPTGETESSGGSLSSHSGRFSGGQALSNHNVRSPDVTSKSPKGYELDDNAKTLSEKLPDAIINIHAKEELVTQQAKVAEEAVSGWERAENEVLALKKQNDELTRNNSSLNERVDHLNGALKECMRQLRRARDEQQDKIRDAIAENSREWESNNADIRAKLESVEKEQSILELKLVSKTEQLERTTKERDISTRAAENASKQHLDSIKRVAKIEAECRRLRSTANKMPLISSESFTNSQSENGDSIDSEPCNCCRTRGKRLFRPSLEIDLMDDFLEMERLAAAIPETRKSELEGNLRKITAEKASLEIALDECRIRLDASRDRLNQTMDELSDVKMQLDVADEAKRDLEREFESTRVKLEKSTKLLDEAELTILRIRDELTKGNRAKTEAESRVEVMEQDLEMLRSSIFTLEQEVEKERSFSRDALSKCDDLEGEISRMKSEDSQFQRSRVVAEFRINQDKELAVAASKFAECQKTIASLDRQLKSLATFEDFLIDAEKPDRLAVI